MDRSPDHERLGDYLLLLSGEAETAQKTQVAHSR